MRALLDFAIALTRAWVATYTRGLPAAVRAERCEEIGADLWEQQRLSAHRGHSVLGTAIEVLGRMLRGISSDILWRAQAGMSARSVRSTKVGQSWYLNMTLTGGVAIALLLLVIGLGPLPALVVGSISVVLAVIVSRVASARVGETSKVMNDRVDEPPRGRWRWLLLITGLSLSTIVGMWLYAITLDHWGDTVTAMGVVALLCLVVATTSFSFLVTDLARGPARGSR